MSGKVPEIMASVIHLRHADTNRPWCKAPPSTMTDEPKAATCPTCRDILSRTITDKIAQLEQRIAGSHEG